MRDTRELLGKLLNSIKNITYENYSIYIMKELCNSLGLKETKLGRWTKKKRINEWIENQEMDNKEMEEYSYIIEPINELDLLVQLGNGYYLGFVFIKTKNNIPVYNGFVNKNYIYVLISKSNKETIYYKIRDIFDEEKIENYLTEYYKAVSSITSKHNLGLTQVLNQEHITLYTLKSSSLIIPLKNNHAIYFQDELKKQRMRGVIEDSYRDLMEWERKNECIKSAKLLSE